LTTKVQANEIARFVLEEITDDRLVLKVPGTSYKLQLATSDNGTRITAEPGKRIKGIIHAKAMRMHNAKAGGKFIEPVWGEPRIVSGLVLAIDESKNRLLVDVSLPMWVEVYEGQQAQQFAVGQMVNFYVQSAMEFEQVQ